MWVLDVGIPFSNKYDVLQVSDDLGEFVGGESESAGAGFGIRDNQFVLNVRNELEAEIVTEKAKQWLWERHKILIDDTNQETGYISCYQKGPEEMSCKVCKKDMLVKVQAKCKDMCRIQYNGNEYDGYTPGGIGIGGGDYVEFTYCLNCGQIQDSFQCQMNGYSLKQIMMLMNSYHQLPIDRKKFPDDGPSSGPVNEHDHPNAFNDIKLNVFQIFTNALNNDGYKRMCELISQTNFNSIITIICDGTLPKDEEENCVVRTVYSHYNDSLKHFELETVEVPEKWKK